METVRQCPKCSGGMEAGAVIEQGRYGNEQVPVWVPENYSKTFFTEKHYPRFPVYSLRCGRCGYLELWAPKEQKT